LGNGEGYSVLEVIETCRQVSGKPIPTIEEGRRDGDPARLIAGSQKAIDELGWKPHYATLEQIVDSAWRWHSAHPNGYSG
jgi:UDP-glucose 4-epimerase